MHARANASPRGLQTQKTSCSALMRELCQCNHGLAISQAESTDRGQELRVSQVAAITESASLRQELKVVRRAAASDALLHSTQSVSRKSCEESNQFLPELQCSGEQHTAAS